MTEEQMDNAKRRFDPNVAADLWRKRQQEKSETKTMDPEKLADEVSDRLIKIIEKEIKKKQSEKAG